MDATPSSNLASRPPAAALWAPLAIAFLARLMHLAAAVKNPASYHLGPDEDYYYQFGLFVAGATSSNAEIFAFMDPLYGLMLGALFRLFGDGVFPVYVAQIVVDTATVALIYGTATRLWDYRAGAASALIYALCAPAVFYTTTLLKATLVAHFLMLWVYLMVRYWRHTSLLTWLGLGCLAGAGVALRSNLILLALASVAMVPISLGRDWLSSATAARLTMILIGLAVPFFLLGERNETLTGKWSVLPPNGGVVLHQNYSDDNPGATHEVPDFVSYRHPRDIWLGYRNEAERRTAQNLSASDVSAYWRAEAVGYIQDHKLQSAGNVLRKTAEFFAPTEVSNNRSIDQDRRFSTVLRLLPNPMPWLLVLGIPGLFLISARNGLRVLPMLAALGTVVLTFAVFIAAARFRFHAIPVLAVASGIALAALVKIKAAPPTRGLGLAALGVAALAVSFVANDLAPANRIDRVALAWGYVRMGETQEAMALAAASIEDDENPGPAHSVLGYLAQSQDRHQEASVHYLAAVRQSPRDHRGLYNLALSLREIGERDASLRAARAANQVQPDPDYAQLVRDLESSGA